MMEKNRKPDAHLPAMENEAEKENIVELNNCKGQGQFYLVNGTVFRKIVAKDYHRIVVDEKKILRQMEARRNRIDEYPFVVLCGDNNAEGIIDTVYLKDYLPVSDKSLTGLEYIHFMKKFFEVIKLLHEKFQVVHGDIHPGNVLVKTANGSKIDVTLVDFGCARNIVDFEYIKEGKQNPKFCLWENFPTPESDIESSVITVILCKLYAKEIVECNCKWNLGSERDCDCPNRQHDECWHPPKNTYDQLRDKLNKSGDIFMKNMLLSLLDANYRNWEDMFHKIMEYTTYPLPPKNISATIGDTIVNFDDLNNLVSELKLQRLYPLEESQEKNSTLEKLKKSFEIYRQTVSSICKNYQNSIANLSCKSNLLEKQLYNISSTKENAQLEAFEQFSNVFMENRGNSWSACFYDRLLACWAITILKSSNPVQLDDESFEAENIMINITSQSDSNRIPQYNVLQNMLKKPISEYPCNDKKFLSIDLSRVILSTMAIECIGSAQHGLSSFISNFRRALHLRMKNFFQSSVKECRKLIKLFCRKLNNPIIWFEWPLDPIGKRMSLPAGSKIVLSTMHPHIINGDYFENIDEIIFSNMVESPIGYPNVDVLVFEGCLGWISSQKNIQKIFANLMKNAVKLVKQGGMIIICDIHEKYSWQFIWKHPSLMLDPILGIPHDPYLWKDFSLENASHQEDATLTYKTAIPLYQACTTKGGCFTMPFLVERLSEGDLKIIQNYYNTRKNFYRGEATVQSDDEQLFNPFDPSDINPYVSLYSAICSDINCKLEKPTTKMPFDANVYISIQEQYQKDMNHIIFVIMAILSKEDLHRRGKFKSMVKRIEINPNYFVAVELSEPVDMTIVKHCFEKQKTLVWGIDSCISGNEMLNCKIFAPKDVIYAERLTTLMTVLLNTELSCIASLFPTKIDQIYAYDFEDGNSGEFKERLNKIMKFADDFTKQGFSNIDNQSKQQFLMKITRELLHLLREDLSNQRVIHQLNCYWKVIMQFDLQSFAINHIQPLIKEASLESLEVVISIIFNINIGKVPTKEEVAQSLQKLKLQRTAGFSTEEERISNKLAISELYYILGTMIYNSKDCDDYLERCQKKFQKSLMVERHSKAKHNLAYLINGEAGILDLLKCVDDPWWYPCGSSSTWAEIGLKCEELNLIPQAIYAYLTALSLSDQCSITYFQHESNNDLLDKFTNGAIALFKSINLNTQIGVYGRLVTLYIKIQKSSKELGTANKKENALFEVWFEILNQRDNFISFNNLDINKLILLRARFEYLEFINEFTTQKIGSANKIRDIIRSNLSNYKWFHNRVVCLWFTLFLRYLDKNEKVGLLCVFQYFNTYYWKLNSFVIMKLLSNYAFIEKNSIKQIFSVPLSKYNDFGLESLSSSLDSFPDIQVNEDLQIDSREDSTIRENSLSSLDSATIAKFTNPLDKPDFSEPINWQNLDSPLFEIVEKTFRDIHNGHFDALLWFLNKYLKKNPKYQETHIKAIAVYMGCNCLYSIYLTGRSQHANFVSHQSIFDVLYEESLVLIRQFQFQSMEDSICQLLDIVMIAKVQPNEKIISFCRKLSNLNNPRITSRLEALDLSRNMKSIPDESILISGEYRRAICIKNSYLANNLEKPDYELLCKLTVRIRDLSYLNTCGYFQENCAFFLLEIFAELLVSFWSNSIEDEESNHIIKIVETIGREVMISDCFLNDQKSWRYMRIFYSISLNIAKMYQQKSIINLMKVLDYLIHIDPLFKKEVQELLIQVRWENKAAINTFTHNPRNFSRKKESLQIDAVNKYKHEAEVEKLILSTCNIDVINSWIKHSDSIQNLHFLCLNNSNTACEIMDNLIHSKHKRDLGKVLVWSVYHKSLFLKVWGYLIRIGFPAEKLLLDDQFRDTELDNRNCLHMAANQGFCSIIEVILQHFDESQLFEDILQIKDGVGNNVLHVAALGGFLFPPQDKQFYFRYIHKHKKYYLLSSENEHGETLLHCCVKSQKVDQVTTFFKHHLFSLLNKPNKAGDMPILFANDQTRKLMEVYLRIPKG